MTQDNVQFESREQRKNDIEVALLRQEVSNLKEDLHDLHTAIDNLTLNVTNVTFKLSKQQTFVGGAVWAAVGFLSFVAFALNYFKH